MQDVKVVELRQESDNKTKHDLLMAHSRVMILMFEATGEVRYLDRSAQDLMNAKEVTNTFTRPMGVILKVA